MPTIAGIDSFQHRVLRVFDQGSVVNDWYSQITDTGSAAPCHDGNSITFDPANARTSDHAVSLKLALKAATGVQIRKTVTGANNVAVASFYFKTTDATNPGGVPILFIFGATNNGTITLNTSGQVRAQVGSGTAQTSATDYCDGQWHRIDAKYDISTTTGTLDVQVDGVALTQATGTVTVGNITDWNFGGTSGVVDYTVWVSDMVLSFTSGDYPIGDHICRMLEINATGTHSPSTGAFTDQAGGTSDAALLAAVDDAWDGTTPELSQTGEDYIQQTANAAAGYVEHGFEDPTESLIWAAQLGVLMAGEDSATTCNCRAELVHSGTIYCDTGLIDPSGSATMYNGYRPAASTGPGGSWSDTELSAAVVRFGFSTDAAPDVVFNSAIVEYVAPWSGSTPLVIQDATHAHAADNLALTQHNVLAIQDATHGHSADNLALTQHNILAIQDASHAHTADNEVLGVGLTVQDATHGHTADEVGLTQHHVLAIQDASHGHAADNLALTQHNVLVIQDAAHGHAADNLVLTQHNALAVQDALHAHAADNLTLTAFEPGGPTTLAIQDAAHAHAADGDLVLGVGLVIADASHGHAADNLVLTQHNVLAIADALHAHTADSLTLSIPGDDATQQNVVRLRRRRPLTGS